MASGKIQNEDIKSTADLIAAGATAASLPNDDKIWVTANSINKTLKQAIEDGDISGTPTFVKDDFTLNNTDISNGYITLLDEAVANSLTVSAYRKILIEGVDYTLSLVSLVTRITWIGDYAVGGSEAFVEGDTVYVQYSM